MLTAVLLSLLAAFVSGAPASTTECILLKQIYDEVAESKNDTALNLNTVFVMELKEQNEHEGHCKIATLCKAKVILSHTQGVLTRALNAYSVHHKATCHGTKLKDQADEKTLNGFLEDLGQCVQNLYHGCHKISKSFAQLH
ncbi:hypothetical protein AALO_G00030130 [Alosa alosa]|uniref:Interleukin-4 n=1 Tax=Alosa alosa TaxID=278164 RepID=A0AAV6HGR9_9TELE|nr:hypothetical protein AALO_G00030130 [Alosa alosa]